MNKKESNPLIAGVLVAVIGGCCVLIAAFIQVTGNFPLEIFRYVINRPGTPTSTFSSMDVPAAGTQLDFFPLLEPGQIPDDIPKEYELLSSSINGIYLSKLQANTSAPSLKAYYSDGSYVPAETDICLVNKGYPEYLQTPLNVRVSDFEFGVTVYTDSRYTMLIQDIDVIVSDYRPARTEIEYIQVGQPGAGGMGLPFRTVRTERVILNKDNVRSYNIDFTDFLLEANQGVNILIPIFMSTDGFYQIQVKINGIATPTTTRENEDLTLTTGQYSYDWVKVDDPRDFEVKQEEGIADPSTLGPVKLVPCQ
jgi:hypothetical protein